MVEPLLKKIRRKKMKRKNNNGIFYVVIALVAVLAVGSWAYAYSVAQNVNVTGDYNYYEAEGQTSNDVNFGGASGNTFDVPVNFYEGYIKGGSTFNASSTLTIARSILVGEIANNKTITVNSGAVAGTVSAASLDLTLPATSTLWSLLKNEGDEYTFDFLNQSPTTATTTEIVAGTGCQLVNGVADGDSTIPGQKGATITIKRLSNWLADGGTKDCVVWVYEWN